MESDGRYMMENNYRYSAELLEYCQAEEVPFIYASSAAVYGAGPVFREDPQHERPLNVYGYSKFLFDQLVRRRWRDNTAQVVGLRYFNVYGPREAHKGRMASVAFHFFNQYRSEGRVKLFEGSGGYDAGEQRRDFVSVEDVVTVNLHFLAHPEARRHLQRRHRPRADVQRGGGGDHQRRAREPGRARARPRSRCCPRA